MLPRSTVLYHAFLTLISMNPIPRLTTTTTPTNPAEATTIITSNHGVLNQDTASQNNFYHQQQHPYQHPNCNMGIATSPNKRKNKYHSAANPNKACSNAMALAAQGKTCVYHAPPPTSSSSSLSSNSVSNNFSMDDDDENDYYKDNDTVFGEILRGQSPALVYAESTQLLAFSDIHRRAPLHALIIPKRFIRDIGSLSPADIDLLHQMHDMAMAILQEHQPLALQRNDYILCFHVPPFTSVSHLHLHVLAPASKMEWYYRHGKYATETAWATSFDMVLSRLQNGQSSSPYVELPPMQCTR